MTTHNKLIHTLPLSVAAALALGAPTGVSAEEASATLNVTAGISTALTLDCSTQDLSFGRTIIDLDTHDGESKIELSPDGSHSIDGNADNLALGDLTPGECRISGSMAGDSTPVTVSFQSSSTTLSNGEAEGLPSADGDDLTLNDLSASSVDLIDGAASFTIGGDLQIPSSLAYSDLGGYRGEVTVTVDDEI